MGRTRVVLLLLVVTLHYIRWVHISGSFNDTSRNSYGSSCRSSRRQDNPIYTEVEQLRAQQEELLRPQYEMERSMES